MQCNNSFICQISPAINRIKRVNSRQNTTFFQIPAFYFNINTSKHYPLFICLHLIDFVNFKIHFFLIPS